MTQFRDLRTHIGWSAQRVADLLGMSERQVRRWDDGSGEPPARVTDWMRAVVDALDKLPPPRKPG